MRELFLFMNIAFWGYTGFISLKYGIQPSISESYYRLPRKLQWLFTIATWGYAIPAMIMGLEFTGNGLIFLAGAGICFVGAAPAFHGLGLERAVHMIGAVVGITAMQILIIISGYWYITASFACLSALAFIIKGLYNHFVWWVEVFAFISLLSYFSILFTSL